MSTDRKEHNMSNLDWVNPLIGSVIIGAVEKDGHPEDDVVAFETANVTHGAIYTVYILGGAGSVRIDKENLSLPQIRERVKSMEDYHIVVYKEEGGSETWTQK